MLRTCLLVAVTVATLVRSGPVHAQSFEGAAPGNYSFGSSEVRSPRPPSSPVHRLEVAGGITLGVGIGVALVGTALAVALTSVSCTPPPGDWFGCLDWEITATIGQVTGEVIAGIGGLAMLVGAILLAGSTTASHDPPRVAFVGGPGDVGAALRFAL